MNRYLDEEHSRLIFEAHCQQEKLKREKKHGHIWNPDTLICRCGMEKIDYYNHVMTQEIEKWGYPMCPLFDYEDQQ
jgi:hypothetical protein